MNRRLTRRTALGVLSSAGALIATSASTRAAEAFTMRFSLSNTVTSVQGLTALKFATEVGRRTNGQIKVEVYPNGQLIKESENISALTGGVVDFSITTGTFLQSILPQLQVLDMPFMFKDNAAAFRVLDGRIGDEFSGDLEAKGIVALSWTDDGFRQFETVNRPVNTPEDLKGLRIRIQAGAVYVATFTALGAIPVTIDSSETYTALSAHTIDAIEYPLTRFTDGKFYTICKHVGISNYVFSVLPVMGSKRKIDALPAPLQKIIREEGKACVAFSRAGVARLTKENLLTLKQNGIGITDVQYSAFRKAVDPVYAQMQAKIGADLIDRVSRAAGGARG